MNIVLNENFILSILTAFFVGAISAYLGSFMVLRRMALVGDALSHVALPGIGIALTFNFNPFLGAFTARAFGSLIIWQIERKTTIPTEAIVGLIFATSLAIGLLVTPEPELLEALFGDISQVKLSDGILAVLLSVFVFAVMVFLRRKLILSTLSKDLAKSQGINVDLTNLVFLALVAVVVALGVKVVGTLLMGALVIIPAIASKNIARNLNAYGILSLIFGIVSAVGGVWLASGFGFPPGPLVVLVSAALFLVSFLFRRG